MVQFKEHEDGKRQTNPKIMKLDKLARLLNVQIKIDGVPYGAELRKEKVVVETTEPSVTENDKEVSKVDTGKLPVDEAKQFVEDYKSSEPTDVNEPTVSENDTTDKPVDETKEDVTKEDTTTSSSQDKPVDSTPTKPKPKPKPRTTKSKSTTKKTS